ncbi:hypothetical protein ENSA5_11820 [Enhygromyxa salina]|uniref:Uncharacterized protein n=1 Tax=Enhygromyxa salina TaxID=215803 RepID=A0A2S9YFX4_9BACT|nr:hypothetical protein ENSA5_11820 [Enhygromyxa salina]
MVEIDAPEAMVNFEASRIAPRQRGQVMTSAANTRCSNHAQGCLDSSATGIGGSQASNAASAAGAVYVFARNGGVWTQQAYVKASNTGASDQFGLSVALSGTGDTLAVGAHLEDSSGLLVGELVDDIVEAVERATMSREHASDDLVSPASDFGDLFGCRPGQRVKVKLPLAVMDVDAIEDEAMEMHVEAERGVGAVDERHGAELRVLD